jgi:hypothetical protein
MSVPLRSSRPPEVDAVAGDVGHRHTLDMDTRATNVDRMRVLKVGVERSAPSIRAVDRQVVDADVARVGDTPHGSLIGGRPRRTEGRSVPLDANPLGFASPSGPSIRNTRSLRTTRPNDSGPRQPRPEVSSVASVEQSRGMSARARAAVPLSDRRCRRARPRRSVALWSSQSVVRPRRTQALCPPRPIAFERATSAWTRRASFGT